MLNNKPKVLFVAPVFFDYHSNVIDELNRRGYSVDFVPDETHFRILFYNYCFGGKYLLEKISEHKIRTLLKGGEYEFCLVIKGRFLSKDSLKLIRRNIEKTYLYQWDSIANFDYSEMIKYFSRVSTFDYFDSDSLDIDYIPLFSVFEKTVCTLRYQDRPYDVLFVGSFHSDRYEVLKLFCSENPNLVTYVHLYVPFLTYVKKILSGQRLDKKNVRFRKVKSNDMHLLYLNSKCVIDIEAHNQSGLTMRSLEAIKNGCKLITTNRNIAKENFYNKNNVYILERENVRVGDDFINMPTMLSTIDAVPNISKWMESIIRDTR